MVNREQVVVGARFIWEPANVIAYTPIEITAVSNNGDEERVQAAMVKWDPNQKAFFRVRTSKVWNAMSRVCEACEPWEFNGEIKDQNW